MIYVDITTATLCTLLLPNEQMRAACEEWGCFVAVHHGIEVELLQQTLQVGHAFFNLPDEVKRKYDLRNFGARWRGYMPFGGET